MTAHHPNPAKTTEVVSDGDDAHRDIYETIVAIEGRLARLSDRVRNALADPDTDRFNLAADIGDLQLIAAILHIPGLPAPEVP